MNEYIQKLQTILYKSMLDTYLANLIEEVEKYQRPRPDGSIDWSKAKPNIIELIKVIGDKAYKRGVEDALKCVPTKVVNGKLREEKWKHKFGQSEINAYNLHRKQTINNITKLLTNK